MKLFSKVFTALFLLVGFFSCENETVDFSIDNEEQLISIIEVFTLGNSQDGSTTVAASGR